MRTAIALIAAFVRIRAHRTLLAVTDGANTIGRQPELHQKIFRGTGAPVAEAEVVLGGPTLVAMAFDHNAKCRISREDSAQQLCIFRQRNTGVLADVAAIVIK